MRDSNTLLITDDDRDFRESLAELLQRRGYRTLQAVDGRDALEVIKSNAIELLVIDVHMPGMTGLETLMQLREQALEIPGILMSAKMNEEIRSSASLIHRVSVLAKPFSIKNLTDQINRSLEI